MHERVLLGLNPAVAPTMELTPHDSEPMRTSRPYHLVLVNGKFNIIRLIHVKSPGGSRRRIPQGSFNILLARQLSVKVSLVNFH